MDGRPISIRAGLAQSVGRTRDHMEDAALSLVLNEGFCEQSRRVGLFIVADGMGGHSNGELASSIAVESFAKAVAPLGLVRTESIDPAEIKKRLEDALLKAQEDVLANVDGGGSTLTAVLVIDRQLFFAHVGDSRLYMVGETGKPELLTRDHSLVQRLVDLGQISLAEAELHPQKNVLYRALGQTDGFKVDLGHKELQKPVQLLLCSDGLWGLLDESRLADTVRSHIQVEERAEQLCEMANEAGGTDNISAIVVEIF